MLVHHEEAKIKKAEYFNIKEIFIKALKECCEIDENVILKDIFLLMRKIGDYELLASLFTNNIAFKEIIEPGMQKEVCKRCNGREWLWNYELEQNIKTIADQRFLCDICG